MVNHAKEAEHQLAADAQKDARRRSVGVMGKDTSDELCKNDPQRVYSSGGA